MSFRCFVAETVTLVMAASLFGQSSAPSGAAKTGPASAVEAKRVRPQNSVKAVPKEAVPTVDQYPFGQLIGELEGAGLPRTATRPEAKSDGAAPSAVPSDWQMPKEVPLSQTAREALHVGQAWMTEKQV